MADVKISALPPAGALDGTELVPIVQAGTTKRANSGQFTASFWVEGQSQVAPNDVVYASTWTAFDLNGNANIDAAIRPAGSGALLASLPDSTAVGGNKRGDNAVDLQMSRSLANEVALGNLSFLAGGSDNKVTQTGSAVVGGSGNAVSGQQAAIVGGASNTANNDQGFIGGGASHTIAGDQSAVIGGASNEVDTAQSAILAGADNTVEDGDQSVICGGSSNSINSAQSFIGGGSGNEINSTASDLAIVGGLSHSITGDGGSSFIGGGGNNTIASNADANAIIGGLNNTINTATGAAIIGGSGLTLALDNTVLVPALILNPPASIDPVVNGQMTFEATSDTTITLKYKGSDGTVRTAIIPLT